MIAPDIFSTTVSDSQVPVTAAAGNHMLFLSGSGDTVSLSGGTSIIIDTGASNTFVLPAAGNGTNTFTTDILSLGDTLDLKAALAATDWSGSAATLSDYVTVTDPGQTATLSIAAVSGGAGVAIATIDGVSNATLTSLLAHVTT